MNRRTIHRINKLSQLGEYTIDNELHKKLDIESVKTFCFFLEYFKDYNEGRASIFLTNEGNIQIEYENKKGEYFEIEFFKDKFEYYYKTIYKERESEYKIEEIEKFREIIKLVD